MIDFLNDIDALPTTKELVNLEINRQKNTLNLIASESIQSAQIRYVMGLPLNKYSEGEPFNKYYQGCDVVSEMEDLARRLVKDFFPRAEYVNVQPHSGNDANISVITKLLAPGDTILSPHLTFGGGHLSHGAPVTVIGKFYNVVQYVCTDAGVYDYDRIRELALEHRPKLLIGGASAYARIIDFGRLRAIADEVGAILLADVSHYFGLIVAGIYPDPTEHAHILTSTTHKTFLGPKGGIVVCMGGDFGPDGLTADIQRSVFPHFQGGPSINNILAKAIAFEQAKTPAFKETMAQIVKNAQRLAKSLTGLGLRVMTGGTDTHQFLVDLRPVNRTGKNVARTLEKAAIVCNMNGIPGDPLPPMVTSGIRLGTTIVTQRGLGEAQMETLAALIARVADATAEGRTKGKRPYIADEAALTTVKKEVEALCHAYPIEGWDR